MLKKFTIIDYFIIVVLLLGVAYLAYTALGPGKQKTERVDIEFTVNGLNLPTDVCKQVKPGDIVCISNKERDFAEVLEVSVTPALLTVPDGANGRYWEVERPDFSDITIKLKAEAESSEYEIKIGENPVRVGLITPVRGKGYALSGYFTQMEMITGSI